MATTLQIRAALEDALANQIGFYRFSGGLMTPAIRIDDGSRPYPEEPNVTGLEVVIQPQLEVAIAIVLGGYRQTFTTVIFLKQWDIEAGTLTALDSVIEAIAPFNALAIGQVRRVLRSTALDNIETMAIPVIETVLLSSG